jgi:hypothetical protein
MRLFDTKKRKARRALTIYFATAEEKQTFDQLAQGFHMSSSTLGTLLLYAGMKQGFKAISGDLTLSGSPANVVDSKPPSARRPRQPRSSGRSSLKAEKH